MATRFAVASTAWNTPSTWDNGAVPLAGDIVYPNGFGVTIDTDISVASLNNNISNVYLPNMAIPAMTSNIAPSGTAFSTQNPTQAYLAFNQTGSTWSSLVANVGTIGYTFTSTKYIVRYYFKGISGQEPTNWVFQGSNDNFTTAGVPLHSGTTGGANYVSPLFTNTVGYTSYRLVVTTCSGSNNCQIRQFEMTESATVSYGAVTGGSFTVPSTLAGTRNIEFTGAGILCSSGTVLTTLHNNGSIVNFNKTTGNYIINPNWFGLAATANAIIHNGTAGGVINFNGDLWGCQVAVANAGASLTVAASAGATTINVGGKIYSARGQAGNLNNTLVLLSGSTTLNVTGDLIPNNVVANPCINTGNTTNTINITGTLNSNIGSCINSSGTCFLTIVGNIGFTNASSNTVITLGGNSTLNVTGTITAPPNANAITIIGSGAITITGALTSSSIGACISSTGTGAITIPTGIVTAGTGVVAISAPSSSLVTTGVSPLINNNNYMAVYAPKIRFYTGAQVEWTFQTSTGGTKILRNADGSSGLPSFTNVKIGQPFGPNNDIIGACIIPPVNTVGVGIPVSTITPINTAVPTTVGTSQLTGEDLLTAISTSSNVVAQRIKNLATVETTGDQLAAFNRI